MLKSAALLVYPVHAIYMFVLLIRGQWLKGNGHMLVIFQSDFCNGGQRESEGSREKMIYPCMDSHLL